MKSYRILTLLIGFALSGLFLTQCKKYQEDDVFIQWKKPEKRLIKYGHWSFEKLTVDDVDKSEEFKLDSAFCPTIFFQVCKITLLRICMQEIFWELIHLMKTTQP